jgi:DNA polymerase-3 subunit beta
MGKEFSDTFAASVSVQSPVKAPAFRCSVVREAMLALLDDVKHASAPKASIPILGAVLLRGAGPRLEATCTTLFVSATSDADATYAEGAMCVDCKELHARVKAFPKKATIAIESNGRETTLRAGNVTARIRAFPVDDYPEVTHSEGLTEYDGSIDASTLGHLLETAGPCVSTDQTRPHLNSLLLECCGDIRTDIADVRRYVRAVATDGHRLVKVEADLSPMCSMFGPMLIALDAFPSLARLCKGKDGGHVSVHVTTEKDKQTLATFKRGTSLVTIKLVDAQFPAWVQVIPQSSEHVMTTGRRALLDALLSIAPSTSKRTGSIKLGFRALGLEITAENPDGGDASVNVAEASCQTMTGEGARIGVNVRYLVDALECLDCESVDVSFTGPLDPIMVTPEGRKGENVLSLVMPMRI